MRRVLRFVTNQTVLDIALALFMCAIGLTLLYGPSLTDDAQFRDGDVFSGFLTVFATLPLAGVLAAIWPARRAARLDVLRAITTE